MHRQYYYVVSTLSKQIPTQKKRTQNEALKVFEKDTLRREQVVMEEGFQLGCIVYKISLLDLQFQSVR